MTQEQIHNIISEVETKYLLHIRDAATDADYVRLTEEMLGMMTAKGLEITKIYSEGNRLQGYYIEGVKGYYAV